MDRGARLIEPAHAPSDSFWILIELFVRMLQHWFQDNLKNGEDWMCDVMR